MRLNGKWSQEIHVMTRGNRLHDPRADRLWVGLRTKITQEEHGPMASWKNILGLFLLESMLRGGMSHRGNNDSRSILWETIQLTSEQRMWPFLTDVKKQSSCQNVECSSTNRTDATFGLSLFFYINSRMQSSYLVQDTTVSHHSSLRVHVLIGPLSFDGHNPLYVSGNDDLPDQLGRQILSECKHVDIAVV